MSEKIEIWGVNDPNISAQLALATQLDLFKQEAGLEVSCRFAESGTTMPSDVLKAEKKPFAFTQTPITSVLLHDKGLHTKILAPLADVAGTQQVIVHEVSNITEPNHLEGRRVGMAKGAAVYIALVNMAKDCHVDLEKVYFINLLPSDQLLGFQEERLDAIACWEPWTTEAQHQGGRFYFSGTRSEIPGMEGIVSWLVNQSCLITPDENLKTSPEMLVEVLKVLRTATDFINHRFEEATKHLAEFFGKTQDELAAIMRKNNYSMVIDTLFRIGALSFRDFLYENGRVSTRCAEEDLYTTELLRQVDTSLVTLKKRVDKGLKIVEKNGVYYQEQVKFNAHDSELNFLLADDSRFVRSIINQVLELLGGTIVGEATNGNEAVELFSQFRPNFVTMDLSMPGLSGVDAIKSILERDPQVNVIVISGLDLQEVREEVFNLGAKMYITKPFDPERTAEVIREMLVA